MQHPPARPWPVALLTRGLLTAAGLSVSAFNRVIRASAPDPSFFDPAGFAWVRDIEASYPDLRRECLQAVADLSRVPAIEDLAGDSPALPGAGQWRALLLMAGGLTVPTNAARLPATHAALRRIPGATTALLSILSPGVHLPRHTGTFAGTLRYHLGLLVPPGGRCRIQVDDEVRTWQEGRSLIFDDTHPHEVWNDSDQLRVVLFVDIPRPLPRPLRLAVDGFSAAARVLPLARRAVERAEGVARGPA